MVLALALLLLAAEPPLPSGVPAPVKGPNPYLSQAKELSQKLDFEKCLKRLAQAPQWQSDASELLEIELVAGMCHYNLNQRGDAEERFRLALRMNPDAELPPYTSPKLVDFFLAVKRKLKAPPPPMPTEDLDMPKEPPVVKGEKEPEPRPPEPRPDEPRVEAEPKLTPTPRPPPAVPEVERPSLLQRRPVPIALGVVAVISAGVGVGLGANSRSLETRANAAYFESDFHKLGDAARTHAIAADVAFAVAGVAAVGAVLGWVLGAE
ncbi:MAG: Tetratricopeptide repeat domain protein [Myxococcaceae bacterium]|nr:Tetratricopeptide repeat domain protein [Myxococcaceae bacterium]